VKEIEAHLKMILERHKNTYL